MTRESAWSQEAIFAAAMEAPEHQQDIAHWLMDEAQKVVSAKVRARVASLASAPACHLLVSGIWQRCVSAGRWCNV